jgi:hypothetical protein
LGRIEMRGLIVGLAIYMVVGVGAEERSIGGFLDGKKLLEFCEEENNKCSGYLMGFVDTMVLTENMLNAFGKILGPDAKRPLTLICFPTSLSFESVQLRRVWMKWAENHPGQLHRTASALVLVAFEEAWPCE